QPLVSFSACQHYGSDVIITSLLELTHMSSIHWLDSDPKASFPLATLTNFIAYWGEENCQS
ncbi:MAG: hypothetical protein Q8S19_10075, partial [Bacillota bacterium]|nr:hypothetical protein [Bacillota bacterium]